MGGTMRIVDHGFCCAASQIYSFPPDANTGWRDRRNTGPVKEYVRRYLSDVIPQYNNRLWLEITLNETQYEAFGDVVESFDFRVVVKGLNINSGNVCYLMIRERQ